jgi:outer membrane protein OmpA-like peptidoglycan-associated protein
MRKLLCILVLMLFLIPVGAFAQQTNTQNGSGSTNANAQVQSSSGATVQQNYSASDPGQGRWFVQPVQPYTAPVVPYLGPWSSGPNILEDLRLLPDSITLSEAEKMYNGGVTARVNKMADGSYQYKVCKLMNSLPMTPLLDDTGNPVKDKDGKEIMVPNEKKFRRVAFIFLQGDKNATTLDVISKAAIEALKMGASGIYLVKKVTNTATLSTGWGIGIGAVSGSMHGTALQQSQAYSAGTGFNRATAEPSYKEGMVVLAIQEIVEVVADKAPLVKTPVRATISLVIDFDIAKSDIKQQYDKKLKELAEFMNSHPKTSATIIGYSDSSGNEILNRELSLKRAESVKSSLVERFGVAPERLSAKGFDSSNPMANNKTVEGRQLNRHINIVIETLVS